MMELKLVFAMLAWSFDVELAQDAEPTYTEKFVAMRGPLRVHLMKRAVQGM